MDRLPGDQDSIVPQPQPQLSPGRQGQGLVQPQPQPHRWVVAVGMQPQSQERVGWLVVVRVMGFLGWMDRVARLGRP